MAGRKDIEAGKAYVSLYADSSALVKGLKAAGQQLQSFGAGIAKMGGAMMGAGAAVLGPLAGMVASFAEAGSALADMSARTGVSASNLSALGYAAGMTGASMEDVEKAIRKMQQNGMSADKIGAIADKMAAMTDPAKKTAFAIKMFGKSGTALIPMLSGGSAGLAAFREEAERLGVVMSDEDAAAADQLGDAMDRTKATLKGVAMQIGAALAPAVTWLADELAKAISTVIQFVRDNRELVVTVAAVAAGIAGAGVVLVGLGGTITVLGMALSGIATLFGAILSPIGLLIGGVALATAAFVQFTETGSWLADTLMGDFGVAFDTVKQTIGGITDALAAGEIGLAANIAMAGVKTAFFEATKSIRGWWVDMLKGIVNAVNVAARAITDAWAGVRIFLRDGIMTNDTTKVDEIAKRTKDLKAKRSTMDPAEYERQYRQLFEETNGTLEAEAHENDDIFQSANNAAAAIDQLGTTTNEVLDAGMAADDDRIKAMRDELALLRTQASLAAAAAKREREAAPGATKPGAVNMGLGSGSGAMTTATFSSSALSALGQGGGPMEKLVAINEDNNRIARRHLKATDEQTAQLRRVEAALTIA
jgi:hypothetical protein